jgi:hypothetical protein
MIHTIVRRSVMILAALLVGIVSSGSSAQNNAHPDAKPALAENPYISFREPWRWDVRAQLFLNSANVVSDDPITKGRNYNERVETTLWNPTQIELVYPVVREGGFYWSPNENIEVSIRLDDVDVRDLFRRRGRFGVDAPDAPVVEQDAFFTQKYAQGTFAQYTHWESGQINGSYRQLHVKHDSHIVCADTVFNDDLARQLPWPDQWALEASAYLSPVVDTVGEPVAIDAEETISTLLRYWIGEENAPEDVAQLDLVKFLTGKVIEYFTIRGQATEFANRTTAGGRPSFVVSSNTWGGFIVRPADEIAKDPSGSRHDLAILLTSVLRSAGVPARTVICIDQEIDDPLLNTVSLVEFAMYDPERDLTFWVPIDVDRVRLTGGRSSQFKRKWLYFGSHDELNHMIPIAYYFHPPARYRAYGFPLLYGIRSMGGDDSNLPPYMIQSLLVDPIVSPTSGGDARSQPED